MNYLGIDWGEVRIGLALADGETKIATPFKTVGNAAGVLKVVSDEQIDVVVVGEPVSITNYELKITNKKFNDFVKSLKRELKISLELVDERLSSKAADALPGGRKSKAPRDAVAAMLILQSWLDRLN
ncbi:hypothetical protein A3H09_00370 [Candidatus Falkowbacteria bacterium RIFCSPLOWO2_12_FULL_45_13]|uniref:Putative pre-16S rRNA nuclease n=2 Tax=Candidatus Falkowiibacteriota TaxID=1752728 RepID=A0A1F5SAF5_9BACT|nr:MAG: hypothetical protein A3H66_02705 [Candidatus Falkowbacteria bacterium RIFCSPLOWO2_02_FULL_45_21]OGF30716.1 MAG: hypothetical protein A3H09_00370 [Candidatus Falkowbacteria bacterium RIFCSPLOWO2_12_FULL_45_13]